MLPKSVRIFAFGVSVGTIFTTMLAWSKGFTLDPSGFYLMLIGSVFLAASCCFR